MHHINSSVAKLTNECVMAMRHNLKSRRIWAENSIKISQNKTKQLKVKDINLLGAKISLQELIKKQNRRQIRDMNRIRVIFQRLYLSLSPGLM